MADVSSFVDKGTIAQYEKGYDDLTRRSRLLGAMLSRRNRITYNHTGEEMVWQAMISLARAKGFAKGSTLEYGSTDPNIQFTAPWRGMYVAESMDIWDVAMNQEGASRLINLFQQKANILMEGLKQDFWQEAFNNGSDSTKPQGIEHFLTHTTCGAADRIATPNGTYGGLSTVLGSQGGQWSTSAGIPVKPNDTLGTDYPDGRGRPEYDATSPMLVNSTSTYWTGTNTWLANAWRVIDQTKTWMSRNHDAEYLPDLALMASDMWTGFRNNQETKTHILMPHKEASDLGFPDTLNMDGLALKGNDFDMTPGGVYVFNLKMMEVCCMLDTLFKLIVGKPSGDTVASFLQSAGFDLDTLSSRMVALFMGNFKFRPKYIAKVASFE